MIDGTHDARGPAVLYVDGEPCPQGSKVAFQRGGRTVMLEGNPKGRAALKAWRSAVAAEAANWRRARGLDLFDGPLRVTLTFNLTRPPSITKRRVWPAVRPDLDKLTRAVFDAITGTLIVDDSRVVELHAYKHYARVEPGPGASVAVEEMT